MPVFPITRPPIALIASIQAALVRSILGTGRRGRGTALDPEDRKRTALARPALVALILCLLLAASIGGNRGGRSLAQEGEATPATPGTPVAIDFDQLVTERPAEVLSGSCDEPGESIASMTPLEAPEGEAEGQGAAIEAESSYSTIPIPLESLLSGQASIAVLLSEEASETVIACGEIGGVVSEGGSLVVKLSERNGSGFTGIAFLAPGDPGTTGASVFRAGPVNFVVTNEGSEQHSLVVEGDGLVFELPAPLDSGESSILSAELPPGEYIVYCPVGGGEHRDKGMEATLLVVP